MCKETKLVTTFDGVPVTELAYGVIPDDVCVDLMNADFDIPSVMNDMLSSINEELDCVDSLREQIRSYTPPISDEDYEEIRCCAIEIESSVIEVRTAIEIYTWLKKNQHRFGKTSI